MKKKLLFAAALIIIAANAIAKEGVYIEFKLSGGKFSGTSKTYSSDGNTRSEMSMISPSLPAPINTVTLVLSNALHMIYTINEKDKTYSEMSSDGKSVQKEGEGDYEVTVVGKEMVNNYNSIHVKVRYKSSKHETEMWLSKDVVGWANYTSVRNQYLTGSKLFEAMKAKGAEGFVVRMLVNGAGENIQMDLVKAEKKSLDESLFSLGGYTKTARTPVFGSMDMEALKKMTPEERQQYIKEMQAKYKQQQH